MYNGQGSRGVEVILYLLYNLMSDNHSQIHAEAIRLSHNLCFFEKKGWG